MFTIGVFADLTGVSAKRLRHYDAIGLFHPAWTDPSSSYRYYLASQIPSLQRIVAMRDLGIGLAAITGTAGDPEAMRALLERRRADVIEERSALERKLAELDIRIEEHSDRDVVIRKRPSGRWASLRRDLEPGQDLGPMFVAVEEVVTRARARAVRPPVAVDHGRLPGGLRAVEVLVPVSRGVPTTGEITSVRTPTALVATSITRGRYPTLDEATRWGETWAARAGYEVVGPTWLAYLSFSSEDELDVPDGFRADADDEFLTEIQVPIREAIIAPA